MLFVKEADLGIRCRIERTIAVVEIDPDIGGIERIGVRMGPGPSRLLCSGQREVQRQGNAKHPQGLVKARRAPRSTHPEDVGEDQERVDQQGHHEQISRLPGANE